MGFKLYFLLLSILFSYFTNAQDIKLRKANEIIQRLITDELNTDRYSLKYVGQDSTGLYFNYENYEDRKERIFQLGKDQFIEKSPDFNFVLKEYVQGSNSYISNRFIENEFIFYERDYFDNPDDYGYTKLYINSFGQDHFLDSINNADKKIHSSFSSDGRYLLVNTLNTLSDYYNPEQDNRIMVYDLSEIEDGKIDKQYLPCTHCSDSYLVSDQLFFTIGRKDGYNGFSNKDIYVAPWENIEDTVKIADNTDILAISPDGKYILGTRFWDRQKATAVIIDVEQNKFQMLLGRDYATHKAFYSYHEDKFAFIFNGYLIYIDFPESYPFDALQWKNEEIPDWTNEAFWSAYQHSPLPSN